MSWHFGESGLRPFHRTGAPDVGQVGNLRPIGNRPADFRENLSSQYAHFFVTTFRSRRLPHYHSAGQATFLTWRLFGSLPPSRSFPSPIASGRAFLVMDRLLDSTCTGPLFLRMPEVAKMVMDAIHYRDQRTYQLHSFVVMPNHVHLLMTPQEAVSKVMQSLKRFTAREGNRMLGLTGQPFWRRPRTPLAFPVPACGGDDRSCRFPPR